MKFTLPLLFICISFFSLSQEKRDIGLYGGTTYYIGDFNPGTPFYQPLPSGGVLFRYNSSNYYSFRLSLGIGAIQGSHNPSKYYLPGTPAPFSSQVISGEGVVEIGFLPFDTRSTKLKKMSPYIVAGIGASSVSGSILPNVPMGAGVKYAFGNRLSLSVEWRFHKTFSDMLDGYTNIDESGRPIVHNNDWYSFGGVHIMYRLYNKKAICPVYR
jgi:hypothetical protein